MHRAMESGGLITGPGFRDMNALTIAGNEIWHGAGGNLENDALSSLTRSLDGGFTWAFRVDIPNAMLTDIAFITNDVGVAVGLSGTVYRTENLGDDWEIVDLDGNLAGRHYNALCVLPDSSLMAAGGNPSNDSIQTIMKSEDRGLTWSIMRDALAPMLYDLEMLDENTGFAVGRQSTILRTEDGGQNWTEINAPGSLGDRDFRDIYFGEEDRAWIAGGIPGEDSVQTLLRSDDGGETWVIEWDEVNPMLYSIDFIGGRGIVAGDNGEVFYSASNGDEWTSVDIDTTINDRIRGLRDVVWVNDTLLVITGAQGKILRYEVAGSTLPEVESSGAIALSSESIEFRGRVNPNGFETMVIFEYGTDPDNLDEAAVADESPVNGFEIVNISALVTGLDASDTYYYRAVGVNDNGRVEGDVLSVFAGENPIPNWDFEVWDSFEVASTSAWSTFGDIEVVGSFNGSNALKIQSIPDSDPGIIFQGSVGQGGPSGYIPFPHKPDSLTGYFNYNIVEGDIARIWIRLADAAGEVLVDSIYEVIGSTNDEWARVAFPINYSVDGTPDSLFILLSSSDFFSGTNPESILTVDDLGFAGAPMEALPNSDFEDIMADTVFTPVSWYTSRPINDLVSSNVLRSDNSQHGDYALLLRNTNEEYGQVSLSMNGVVDEPAFPLGYKFETMRGAYVFDPVTEGDSLSIWINVFDNGELIGAGITSIGGSNSEYQEFEVGINYFFDPVGFDSANIQINLFSFGDRNSTFALIDNLTFDGVVSDVVDLPRQSGILELYPNPVHDELNILVPDDFTSDIQLEVYTTVGQKVLQRRYGKYNSQINLAIDEMAAGTYVAVLTCQDQVHLGVFIVH